MELGEFVDFCIEWNDWSEADEEKEKKQQVIRRKATQSDWDNFFG